MFTYVCTRTHVGTDETDALKHAINTIVEKSMYVDIDMCVFTNVHVYTNTLIRRYECDLSAEICDQDHCGKIYVCRYRY